jgi:hypothetical protein
MAIKKLVLSGKWVVKNLDGDEKRFDRTDSPDAVEWKNSRSSKKKLMEKAPKFSQEWWSLQSGLTPMSRLMSYDETAIGTGLKAFLRGSAKLSDHTFMRQGHKIVDGVTCAYVQIRCILSYGKSDDLGTDADTTDGLWVIAVRDSKNPRKFNFQYMS